MYPNQIEPNNCGRESRTRIAIGTVGMRTTLLRTLPQDRWDQNDDLVSPCSIEMVVVKALATTHASVTAYTSMTKGSHHDVDNHIVAVIISGMISIRLGFMKVEVPDMPVEISDLLCSICKEILHTHLKVW